MFTNLQSHRREHWRRRTYMLLRSWNALARRGAADGRLIAFFGSSNLFWPYSMDRQLGEILARRGTRDVVLNLGSFGFGDSAHVLSTTRALLGAYRDRPIDLLIFEATPNEMPPLDKDGTRAWLRREAGTHRVIRHDLAAPVVSRLHDVHLPLRSNLERLAEIARAQASPFPVVVLDYESNLREWAPSVSYFSRALSDTDAVEFETRLAAAIDLVRRGRTEAAFEQLRHCRAIDPDVALAAYLEAKVAEGLGDADYAACLYRRARNLDLLRGRLSRERLMPELESWCKALGFWFVSVPAIVQALAPQQLPGFDRFVDDVHYRPHVHFAIASAIADRLAAEGWSPANGTPLHETDVLAAVNDQRRFVLLQCALNLVMAPPSPYNDERIAEGVRSLDEAARHGVEPVLLDEYRLRFKLLANASATTASPAAQAAEAATADPQTPHRRREETTGQDSAGEIGPRIARLLLARFGLQIEAGLEHADLLGLGIDSLGLAELITTVAALFDVTLDDRLFDRQVTFASLCDLVAARLVETPVRRIAHERSLARQRALAWRRPVPAPSAPSRPAAIAAWTTADGDRQTIAGILARHFRDRRQDVAITLLPPGTRDADQAIDWTWGDLDDASAAVVAGLRDAGVIAGDVVHLLTGHGAFTAAAIVGALRIGVIPSIGHAPSPKLSADVFAETFGELLRRSRPRAVIVPPALEALVRRCIDLGDPGDAAPLLLSSESIVSRLGSRAAAASTGDISTRAGGLALLQYSSGTTGARKGVMFDEGAILRQIAHYARAIDLRTDDRIVSWLPLYHDMGLVACFLLPLLTGTPLTLMSPFDWIAAPQLLFQAVTRDRGTLVWLPNFAFRLLADRVGEEQLQGVDLSSLRAVINCAEPIRLDSWERFHDRFAFHGLSRVAFSTCYAMAENIFAVTQGGTREPVWIDIVDAEQLRGPGLAVPADPARDDDDAAILAVPSSGQLIEGSRARIVSRDDGRTVLGDRQVGAIEIAGDSLASGYYHNESATQASFRGGWYSTGDIGYLAEGHLFVLGRMTDVIIVAGINLFADDVEQTASRVAGVKAGRVAAFGVWDEHRGTERVVVLFESEDPALTDAAQRTLQRAIQQRLYDALQVAGCEVLPVPAGAIRKTSSGKVARQRMKQAFLDAEREEQGRRNRGEDVEHRRQDAVLAQ
jgi:fatty-acyl-CoA synthase